MTGNSCNENDRRDTISFGRLSPDELWHAAGGGHRLKRAEIGVFSERFSLGWVSATHMTCSAKRMRAIEITENVVVTSLRERDARRRLRSRVGRTQRWAISSERQAD